MRKKQVIFLLVVLTIYLLIGSGLISRNSSYRLAADTLNHDNKLVNFLAQLIYLDNFHSKLVLQEGLPVIRVARDKKLDSKKQKSPFLTSFAFEFITGLPMSFFQFDSGQEVEQATSRLKTQDDIDQQVKEKMKAEGTHEDEEKRKVELDFWQTEPPSEEKKDPAEFEEEFKNRPRDDSDFSDQDEKNRHFDSEEALIGVYHSHTSENYENKGYRGNARAGERGHIVDIGKIFQEELEKNHGIPTVHSKKVHDENYSRSYLASLQTAKQLVKNNSHLRMLFDLHRDALGEAEKSRITTTIEGEKAARILIIVTTDDYLPNPYWQKNLEVAKKLAKKMEQMHPGLLREIELINNRRYNQHLQPGSLLVEIGGVRSTIPEAKRSARLFAEVVASIIQEEV